MDLKEIEKKWQHTWKEAGVFETDPVAGKKKYYVNFPYPYMNGYLHIGHAFSLMRVEILARYKRMTGHNVLFPFAFHCTGTPIVAAATRIKQGEKVQEKILRDMGIPEDQIPDFADPLHWTRFFPKEARRDIEWLGVGIDWRRTFITTSLNPFYSKFIEWQFLRLKEEGLVKTGIYPVIWCPNCNAPTGDHARLKGEGERPQEFTLLKFRIVLEDHMAMYGGNIFLLAATLRPETVFGQTNLWVDPDHEYVLAEMIPAENPSEYDLEAANIESIENGEEVEEIREDREPTGERKGDEKKELWILSDSAVTKLIEQKKDLRIIGTIKGTDIIGKTGSAPAIHREIPVLPSHFCDPDKGTGIVTSVPSDAPDDWMGLYDLQQDPDECRKYGLDPVMIQAIEPIPIIDTSEWGTNPAVKICQQMEIQDQFQRDKLILAKKEIYKYGFYTGKMTDECGEFTGQPVEQVKDLVKEKLIQEGEAELMYEPSGEVICRCLTPCVVKTVDDQWFIAYSDPAWKEVVHDALDSMILYPELVRKQFDYVVDWLNDWACTREFGLGTPLPWDNKWLIESLSDSTIYMAYYTISKYLENGVIQNPDTLGPAFFNYIFRGKGNSEEIITIATEAGIDVPTLEEMRNEFQYWYPFDLRGSGKDLVQNHLTFCIFTHVAVFGRDYAPRGFGVNGWIKVGGDKMAKSAGNFYTLREVLGKYGSDIVRLTLGSAGEGLEDPNWEHEFAETAGKRLIQWADFALENYSPDHSDSDPGHDDLLTESTSSGSDLQGIDLWFLSRLNRLVKETVDHMEQTNFRSALKSGYFELQNAYRKYQKRKLADPHPAILNRYIECQTRILAPYVPHITQEIWNGIGKEEFIVDAPYPVPHEESILDDVERQEDFISDIIDDVRKILKVTRIEPEKIYFYIAQEWKYQVLTTVLDSGEFNVGKLMKLVMADPELRKHGKEVNKYIQQIVKDRPSPGPMIDEYQTIVENIDYLSSEFGCKVQVFHSDDEDRYDPANKGKLASPFKPGIYIE